MNTLPHIAIVTNFNDHFRFFARLAKSLIKKNIKITFVTNRFSIAYEARKMGFSVVPVTTTKNLLSDILPKNLEQISGLLSEKESRTVYSSTVQNLNELHQQSKIDQIYAWGGIRIMDASTKAWAKQNEIKTLFFELANFPNKMFADPEGTNAQSSLANDCSFLDEYSIDEREYNGWVKDYIDDSLKKHTVPQSKGATSIDVRKNIFDLYGTVIRNHMKFEPILDLSKFKNKLLGRIVKFEFEKVSLKNDKFAFYPMQVSVDAQILVNSSTNNLEALKNASKEAKSRGLKLFVKPHPAERDTKHIQEVYKLKEELGFYFIDGNTIEIIQNSDLVITINSTVGLQGLILEKEVVCLGKAFYAKFTKSQLASYIQNYLLNIDFWGSDSIPDSEVEKILNRVN